MVEDDPDRSRGRYIDGAALGRVADDLRWIAPTRRDRAHGEQCRGDRRLFHIVRLPGFPVSLESAAYRCDLSRALISWASCSSREESTNRSEMLGTWSMAPSMPESEGSAAPSMSFTLRARLPNESSAMACSSATIDPQSSCGPPPDGPGGVVGATESCCDGGFGGVA